MKTIESKALEVLKRNETLIKTALRMAVKEVCENRDERLVAASLEGDNKVSIFDGEDIENIGVTLYEGDCFHSHGFCYVVVAKVNCYQTQGDVEDMYNFVVLTVKNKINAPSVCSLVDIPAGAIDELRWVLEEIKQACKDPTPYGDDFWDLDERKAEEKIIAMCSLLSQITEEKVYYFRRDNRLGCAFLDEYGEKRVLCSLDM